ncbi:uncharacterized protein LOC124813088 [Hydra vulgaris]|uniref:uncharacterized protein LOC124813088 n=1 Tax=Hydra vulgaris TaxID=6087 RepID=UPI0032EA5BBE
MEVEEVETAMPMEVEPRQAPEAQVQEPVVGPARFHNVVEVRNYTRYEMEGSPTIWFDEFQKAYVLSKDGTDARPTTYLKCHRYTVKRGSCGGTARIKDDTLYLEKDHSCGDMSDEYLILQAKARMKFRAGQTTEPLRDIWNSVLSQSTEAVKKNLKFEAAESIMRNKRRKNLPPIPKNLAEMKKALDNGHSFKDIYQGFVEFEDGKVGFIFADPKLLALVEKTQELFVDATFKTRPHHDIFSQLLNIIVIYKDYSVAVMHVLMTCKEQALYGQIMERFKALVGSDFKPKSVMSDYERAILNTMQTAFPESRVSGCRFHFSQAGK